MIDNGVNEYHLESLNQFTASKKQTHSLSQNEAICFLPFYSFPLFSKPAFVSVFFMYASYVVAKIRPRCCFRSAFTMESGRCSAQTRPSAGPGQNRPLTLHKMPQVRPLPRGIATISRASMGSLLAGSSVLRTRARHHAYFRSDLRICLALIAIIL
jgi:hypothetical protein